MTQILLLHACKVHPNLFSGGRETLILWMYLGYGDVFEDPRGLQIFNPKKKGWVCK